MERRLTAGGVLAIAAHAAALVALGRAGSARTVVIETEIELEVQAEARPVEEPPAHVTPTDLPAARPRRAPGSSALVAPRREHAAALALPSTAEDAIASGPAPGFTPFGATTDLHLGRAIGAPGGSSADAPPSEPRREPAPADPLRDGLRGRDEALGLGPEGPILSALTAATHASRAPLHDSATFEATIGADGRVSSLRVLDGADEGWDDARERALAELAGKVANLRGRDGAVVLVRVTSRTVEAPKGILDKAGAVLFLELGELARKQQRSVHVRLLSVR